MLSWQRLEIRTTDVWCLKPCSLVETEIHLEETFGHIFLYAEFESRMFLQDLADEQYFLYSETGGHTLCPSQAVVQLYQKTVHYIPSAEQDTFLSDILK